MCTWEVLERVWELINELLYNQIALKEPYTSHLKVVNAIEGKAKISIDAKT